MPRQPAQRNRASESGAVLVRRAASFKERAVDRLDVAAAIFGSVKRLGSTYFRGSGYHSRWQRQPSLAAHLPPNGNWAGRPRPSGHPGTWTWAPDRTVGRGPATDRRWSPSSASNDSRCNRSAARERLRRAYLRGWFSVGGWRASRYSSADWASRQIVLCAKRSQDPSTLAQNQARLH